MGWMIERIRFFWKNSFTLYICTQATHDSTLSDEIARNTTNTNPPSPIPRISRVPLNHGILSPGSSLTSSTYLLSKKKHLEKVFLAKTIYPWIKPAPFPLKPMGTLQTTSNCCWILCYFRSNPLSPFFPQINHRLPSRQLISGPTFPHP